jgi:hypothetical protein
MTVDLDFTRQDFERALEHISFNPGIFDHVVQCSGCNTTVRGIIALYCLREPRASEHIAILRIHLPYMLSNPRIREELGDKLFRKEKPTYEDLGTVAQLMVQIAYCRFLMTAPRRPIRFEPSLN